MKSSRYKEPGISAIRSACMNENGAVLVISLALMALLSMLGITAVVMTTTDMKIGANYRDTELAFNDAEAGVDYGLGKIEEGLKAATFTMPTVIGDPTDSSDSNSVSLSAFTTPTGFGFSIKAPGLTMLDTNLYTFSTDGTGTNNSSVTITVTCRQKRAVTMAAFGDKKLDIKSSAVVTSYDSGSSDPSESNPLTATTHLGDIGSNEWLRTGSGSSIDGSGILGEDVGGAAATNAINDPNDFYGSTPSNIDRVDPDPLGVTSGGEYDPTTYAGGSNDNALATGLVGDTIAGGTPATLYGGPAGATANYYLTSIIINNGDTLTIDTSSGRGDVRVFLTGAMDAKTGSQIVLNPASYDAGKFAIFSNSTAKVSIKNSADFTGLIYAPYSTNVDIMNGADFYGAVWGSNVELKNSGNVRYDSALADKFTTKDMEMLSWLDVRN